VKPEPPGLVLGPRRRHQGKERQQQYRLGRSLSCTGSSPLSSAEPTNDSYQKPLPFSEYHNPTIASTLSYPAGYDSLDWMEEAGFSGAENGEQSRF